MLFGLAVVARFAKLRRRAEWLGCQGEVSYGQLCTGSERLGAAVLDWSVCVSLVLEGQGSHGALWHGKFWTGGVNQGKAWRGSLGVLWIVSLLIGKDSFGRLSSQNQRKENANGLPMEERITHQG